MPSAVLPASCTVVSPLQVYWCIILTLSLWKDSDMRTNTVLVLLITAFVLICPVAAAQNLDGSGAPIGGESSAQSDDATSTYSNTSSDSNTSSEESSSDSATSSGEGGEKTDLKNLEALVSIIGAFGMGAGVVTAISLFTSGVIVMIMRQTKKWLGGILIAWSVIALIGGIMTPGVLNWFMASAKDANLFE